MKINLVGPFIVNAPFGTEIAFSKGLKKIGVEVVEVDPNVDMGLEDLADDADATVVFKSCVGAEDYLDRVGGIKIVYQPDDARFPHIKQMMINMRAYCDNFLSFDKYGAELATMMRYETSEVLLLTADNELYSPPPNEIEKDIDISFIGSLGDPIAHASRRKMINLVDSFAKQNGLKTFFGSTNDTSKIVDVYRRSKVVLNHATDVGQYFGYGYGLQCRHFEVGMTRTCLLSNELINSIDCAPLFPTFSTEKSLIENLQMLLSNDELRNLAADKLYYDINDNHLPEHRAKQLVDYIEKII